MAEQQVQIPGQQQQPQARQYVGRPENQRDPNAKVAPVKGQQQQRRKPPLPRNLPKPTKMDDAQGVTTKPVERSPLADSLFAEDMTIREYNLRTLQKPSLCGSVEIARLSFQQMLTDDPNLAKAWTREAYEYYSTAMAWLRIVHLKAKNLQEMTMIEETLQQASSTQSFNIPEPLRVYLSGIGNVTSKTGQHLFPEFPPLPTTSVDGLPGTYGRINVNTHNAYEEVPCLGIHVGMIRATLNQDNPIPQWVPPVLPAHLEPTENLLGYHRIRKPRQEALALFDANGITDANFPCYPANTGFNFGLLRTISAIIAGTKTFKITPVNFLTYSEGGTTAQLVIERSVSDDPSIRTVNSELRVDSLTQETTGTFGMAITFCYQLMKEPVEGDHTTWCCVKPTEGHPIPENYIANRNSNRTLPEPYHHRVFNSVSLLAGDYRNKIIEKMVMNKR